MQMRTLTFILQLIEAGYHISFDRIQTSDLMPVETIVITLYKNPEYRYVQTVDVNISRMKDFSYDEFDFLLVSNLAHAKNGLENWEEKCT